MDKYTAEYETDIRVSRLKKAMKRYGIKQSDFEKKGFNKATVSQWLNGQRKITVDKMRDIKRELLPPQVSLEYLLGDDEYMTLSDHLNDALTECALETSLLNPSVINLLRLSGYTVKTYYEDGITGSVFEILKELKNYCSISKDGKTKILDIGQFNKLANLVCDYTDFIVQTTL